MLGKDDYNKQPRVAKLTDVNAEVTPDSTKSNGRRECRRGYNRQQTSANVINVNTDKVSTGGQSHRGS